MTLDLDRALAVLFAEIQHRAWGEDSDLMRATTETLILMRERIDSLSQQNRELREILATSLGKPLPKGDLK